MAHITWINATERTNIMTSFIGPKNMHSHTYCFNFPMAWSFFSSFIAFISVHFTSCSSYIPFRSFIVTPPFSPLRYNAHSHPFCNRFCLNASFFFGFLFHNISFTVLIGECRECLPQPCPLANENLAESNFVCNQNEQTELKCEFEMLRCIFGKKYGYNVSPAYVRLFSPQIDLIRFYNTPFFPFCAVVLTVTSSLATAYEGECCFTSCPGRWQPVCDSRNVTHELQNLCEFGIHRCLAERLENANITISRYQACEHEHCARRCSQLYEPVCASNGETYRNECELNNVICVRNKKISPERKPLCKRYLAGECCGEIKCDPIFSPVCDSEGKTHANRCEFRKAACLTKKLSGETLTVQYNRQCCNQLCDGEVKPVCDGENTYDNLCKFRVAQCEAERRGEILSLAYSGRCCEEPKDKCSVSGPLCDSEGQTHANMCRFLRKQCVLNKVQPKSLSIAHRGECCRTELCTTYNEPVCDTHGVTHASPCHFRNTKCIYDKMHFNATLQIDYTGACCVSSCDDTWDGVCDQNGVLYKNKCYFEMKRCEANRRFAAFSQRILFCRAQLQHPLIGTSL
ncbi:unnamed protein product [Toxocara canis]|uniref:Agrin n=1 Tax=Toxocara canis TaxID=6265 RepID=A0A183TV59_TOXCA|nr:unnamed protein product [Toxocara canis]